MLVFDRFDSSASGFPPPAIPLLPPTRWRDLTLRAEAATAKALRSAQHFNRGRYALHAAFALAGAGPGATVLAPSYHCRTIVDPALTLGATVDFYSVDTRLAPSLGGIAACIARATMPVKALVLPHYFGFAQAAELVDAIASLCAQHSIVLIEDCSHSWQLAVEAAARPLPPGRMVMASPYKFFATPDGGALWCGRTVPSHPQHGAGLVAELKAVLRVLRHRRQLNARPAVADGAVGIDRMETTPQVSIHYLPAQQAQGGLALSRWIMRHTRVAAAARRRQAHFRTLAALSARLAGARALFDRPPAGDAPYMFALRVDQPEAHFDRLKRRGVPIWRWDDMARSDCAVAREYRLGLFHLPCHQAIDDDQMAWMCQQLRDVLGSGLAKAL